MPIELITKKQNIELVVPAGKGVTEAYDKGYAEGYEAGEIEGVSAGVEEVFYYVKAINLATLNVFKKPVVEITFGELHNGSLLNFIQVGAAKFVNTTVEHITINTPAKVTSIQQMFYSATNDNVDKTLKHITLNFDTSNCTAFNNSFSRQTALEIIDGEPLNCTKSSLLTTLFTQCNSLREVRFVPNTISQNISIAYSANLSDETIESVIAGLKDLTGATASTITFHKTVGANLTEAQREAIAAKNWTLTY